MMEIGSTWYDDKTMEYFWVKPADYVYLIEPPHYEAKATFDHYNAWLTQTFGPGGWWYDDAKWLASDRKYYFRKEQDRMLFLLRFGE